MKNSLLSDFRRLLLFASTIILLTTYDVRAQQVQLTNTKSNRQLKPIIEGMRVKYLLKPTGNGDTPVSLTGFLTKISSDELTIDGKTIKIKDLQGFGRKKKGSNFFGWLLTSLGNTIWISTVVSAGQDDTPKCTNCTVYVNEDASSKAGPYIFTGLGLGVAFLGIRTLVRNAERDVVNKWKLEIVENPK